MALEIEIDIPAVQAAEKARAIPKAVTVVLDIDYSADGPEPFPEIVQGPEPFGGIVQGPEPFDEVWGEMVRVKKERDIISTRTARMVEEITDKLQKESPALANEFLAGNLPMPELAEQYEAIQALTDQAIALYDKTQHQDRYGSLGTALAAKKETSHDVMAIQHQIRRLDDSIYKTRKKLTTGKPKNPSRVAMWNEKIALDEARRNDLKAQLKRLQYESRG